MTDAHDLSTLQERADRLVAHMEALGRYISYKDRPGIRLASGLTPTEMGRRIGVSGQMLSKLERTPDVPDKAAFIRYVDLLDELIADPTIRAKHRARQVARAEQERRRDQERIRELGPPT
jgi:DNA-binding transcriptional regulator YiaG